MVDNGFLSHHSLFGGVADEDLDFIRTLLNEQFFRAGQNIVTEGDACDRLYLIYEGSVEVMKRTADGTEKQLAILKRGDTFGEMELIDIQPLLASVRAREDVCVLGLKNHDMHDISKRRPQAFLLIVMNIAREISRRLRRMSTLCASTFSARSESLDSFTPHHPETAPKES